MRVQEVMTEDPVCCIPNTTIQKAAQMMADRHIGEIPVVDNNESRRLVGVVTDRDICCRAVAQGKSPSSRVVECMSEPVVAVTPDADIDRCRQIMEENQIRRLPVVDQQGCCCGIISQADISRVASEQDVGHLLKQVSQPAESASQVGQTKH